MSGPNPPGRENEESDSGKELSDELDPRNGVNSVDELAPVTDSTVVTVSDHTGETDVYSQAYSAPEVDQFTDVSYVPADLKLYDYDESLVYDEPGAPRWPWVVGVAAILAAIALVVSVSLLVTRTDTSKLATPTTSRSTSPVQDEITTAKPPPPSTETSTATETRTVTVTPLLPPSATNTAAPPSSAVPPPPTTPTTTATTPTGPRQVTYSVTGTKAPGDIISVTYVDASGRRRTQHNVYIPWSMTVTPISQSDVGSVEAFSLFRVSKLNCLITTSDGTVLSSNSNDAPQTSC
ncbi:MmpS family transport accessory protein [Mycobacterium lepromatosis]|uniref:Probable transport accessory protein MmpS3 n=1 Tax=Mycobacterium lepromatosis TaxID=480418 RepID=A0A0F4EUX6_9MYCO|nr:MmpS family transport accessory protein [Mycobacterium lepromatosis]KJX75415.1 membrane protein MmpS3 [Mycobacterium lepromatosis]UKN42146.1 membrane protein [Mycobacterium lepromatosis]